MSCQVTILFRDLNELIETYVAAFNIFNLWTFCSHYRDRILIPDVQIRRLFLRLTRKWSKKGEQGEELTQAQFEILRRRVNEGKYSFLKCLVPQQHPGTTSHLFRNDVVGDVITAVAKDVAPIAGGVVKNFRHMKQVFEYVEVLCCMRTFVRCRSTRSTMSHSA